MVDGLKDETNYVDEDRQDLVSRLMSAQALDQFLFSAYDALKHYGVDFKSLPEWEWAVGEWQEARRLKPHRAQEKIIASIMRLDHALKAAVKRKQFKLLNMKEPEA